MTTSLFTGSGMTHGRMPQLFISAALCAGLTGCGGGGGGGVAPAADAVTIAVPLVAPATPVAAPVAPQSVAPAALPNPASLPRQLSVASCSEGTDTSSGQAAYLPAAEWTYMLYMAADNSLDSSGLADLAEIRAAAAQLKGKVNIVIQYETDGSATHRELINSDGSTRVIMNNVDMACGSNLKDFVRYARAVSPSKHYALGVWSHGAGWRGGRSAISVDDATRGIIDDRTSGSFMTIDTLRKAIVDSGVPIELIDMDACTMGMAEVVSQLGGVARYLVGSQGNVPSLGHQYTDALSLLAQRTDQPVPAGQSAGWTLGQILLDTYRASYSPLPQFQDKPLEKNLYSLEPAKVTGLNAAIQELSQQLIRAMPQYRDQIQSARQATVSFDIPANRDVGDFARQVAANVPDAQLQASAERLLAAQQQVVLQRHVFGGNASYQRSTGLAIFLPSGGDTSRSDLNAYQNQMTVSGLGDWSNLVNQLVEGATVLHTVPGRFSARLTWNNPNVDLDLWVKEPVETYGIFEGNTTSNGFFSPDSFVSKRPVESYTARDTVQAGQYRFYVLIAPESLEKATDFTLCITSNGTEQCEQGRLDIPRSPLPISQSSFPFSDPTLSNLLHSNQLSNWYASSQIIDRGQSGLASSTATASKSLVTRLARLKAAKVGY